MLGQRKARVAQSCNDRIGPADGPGLQRNQKTDTVPVYHFNSRILGSIDVPSLVPWAEPRESPGEAKPWGGRAINERPYLSLTTQPAPLRFRTG